MIAHSAPDVNHFLFLAHGKKVILAQAAHIGVGVEAMAEMLLTLSY